MDATYSASLQVALLAGGGATLAALATRLRPVPGLLERVDDLSAVRQFPHLKQSRETCAGFEPFTL